MAANILFVIVEILLTDRCFIKSKSRNGQIVLSISAYLHFLDGISKCS